MPPLLVDSLSKPVGPFDPAVRRQVSWKANAQPAIPANPTHPMRGISVIIPTYNEAANVEALVERLVASLKSLEAPYELRFIDDRSSDDTVLLLEALAKRHPIVIQEKQGPQGKAYSLLEGFAQAKYAVLAMIDADLQYPPEAIPEMYRMLDDATGVVVAKREYRSGNGLRELFSRTFSYACGTLLHGLHCDVQSGLKVFKSEAVRRLDLNPTGWTFDLEFLVRAEQAGYAIKELPIDFGKRTGGRSSVHVIRDTWNIGSNAVALKVRPAPTIAVDQDDDSKGFHYRGRHFIHHSGLHHSESALYRTTLPQKLLIIAGILFIAAMFLANWHATLLTLVALLTVLYFLDLLFNLFLIYRSFSKSPELIITPEELAALPESHWPTYSIFCPLYKEWEVVPQFVDAMAALDYPKDRLQVMLLLEENDPETIAEVAKMNLPDYFEVVVVPHSLPKTKPKACNYGLKFATGEYVVIYDAEDAPDPDQLKKAVLAFGRLPETVACVQAKLNFYNPHQNILTRVFTAEYSLWFDLVLTGLQSINAPIPLGGTSNHFRRADLHRLKGWDAFNVTEDCDLGIRMVKQGLTTAIVDSTTWEEANSSLKNWFPQRTRWIKGYIQSYLVHMRNPKAFLRDWKRLDLITFQLVVGGKVLSMFINPFMWTVTILYFALRAALGPTIESFFPTPIFYMAVFSLVFGNFLYVYYYMIGCAKRGYDDIIKYVFLIPLYWLAMSYCAWLAMVEIVHKPHHWAKTKHGLHLKPSQNKTSASELAGLTPPQ